MGISGGPDTTTDGLLIAIDTTDTNSYRGTGNVVFDLCGNSNVTLNGTTSVVSGSVSGSSLNIPFMNLTGTGTSNFGSFSNRSVMDINNSSYEFFAFWGTLGTGGPDTLYSREDARFYATAYGGGGLGGFVRGNAFATAGQFEGSLTGNGAVTTNTWYHLVFTVDFTSTFAVYKNGVLAGSTNISALGTGFISPTGGFNPVIGSRYGGSGTPGTKMTGGMSVFRFYNRPLAAGEVLQNYNALKTRYNL
jgi:hypothetical protein